MKKTSGNPKIVIGIIDGPVDLNHHAFDRSNFIQVSSAHPIACTSMDDAACIHGTSIAGILAAKRGLPSLSICPSCTFALFPIFSKHNIYSDEPHINELADAIRETVDSGARIINLSLGLKYHLSTPSRLEESYTYARNKGVIVVISSGNQGQIGSSSLLNNEWIIPVSSCDQNGIPLEFANFGKEIGKNGILAPGINLACTFPNGVYGHCQGTSVSAALVTGAVALLWSLYPETSPTDIIYAVRKSGASHGIIPALLNGEAAVNILKINQQTL